jgi:hypothetical protein
MTLSLAISASAVSASVASTAIFRSPEGAQRIPGVYLNATIPGFRCAASGLPYGCSPERYFLSPARTPAMSKSKDTKKETKKPAAKTPKEKKEAKKLKQQSRTH